MSPEFLAALCLAAMFAYIVASRRGWKDQRQMMLDQLALQKVRERSYRAAIRRRVRELEEARLVPRPVRQNSNRPATRAPLPAPEPVIEQTYVTREVEEEVE